MVRYFINLVMAVAASGLVAASCGSPTDENSTSQEVLDRDILEIAEDLNEYWAVAAEDLGFEYVPVPESRITTGLDGKLCNAAPIDPADVEGNAFVDSSCEEGITVAYDPEYVRDSLAQAEATMAHEWGHVLQAQAIEIDLSEDSNGLPIDAELQADCFAGAWAAERAEGKIDRLRSDTVKAADPDGVEVDDPHAHGTGEQRAASFDVGVRSGPIGCVNELVEELPE